MLNFFIIKTSIRLHSLRKKERVRLSYIEAHCMCVVDAFKLLLKEFK